MLFVAVSLLYYLLFSYIAQHFAKFSLFYTIDSDDSSAALSEELSKLLSSKKQPYDSLDTPQPVSSVTVPSIASAIAPVVITSKPPKKKKQQSKGKGKQTGSASLTPIASTGQGNLSFHAFLIYLMFCQ